MFKGCFKVGRLLLLLSNNRCQKNTTLKFWLVMVGVVLFFWTEVKRWWLVWRKCCCECHSFFLFLKKKHFYKPFIFTVAVTATSAISAWPQLVNSGLEKDESKISFNVKNWLEKANVRAHTHTHIHLRQKSCTRQWTQQRLWRLILLL